MENFNVSTNRYKVFSVGDKYGILTWDNHFIFAPKCTTPPDVEALEKYGYTFIQLEEGCNLIDTRGQIYLETSVAGVMWFIQNKIVAFIDNDGTKGLFFVTERRYILNIDDVSKQKDLIATFLDEKKGLATYSGQEIFKPAYSAVASFDTDIYIAYTDDGGAILNSLSWEKPTEKAESFQIFKDGILAKFSSSKYGWINPKTGKTLKPEEQSSYQRFCVEFSEKKAGIKH